MRTCAKCGGAIPAERRADALYCSTKCGNNHRNHTHYHRQPDRAKERRDHLKATQLNRYMVSRAKWRAKSAGVPFNITPDDVSIPAICPVLGLPIRPAKGHGGHDHHSPSLDRIDPNKGYVKGNVRVISQRANLLKSDATVEELEAILNDLRRLRDASTI